MELDDCAFPLLAGIDIHDDPRPGVRRRERVRCSWARGPRTKGMERADLLEANGGIFKPQGEAIAAGAADDVKVLVVGNPANTNALIAHVERRRRARRALHRDDAARPEPGDDPAGQEGRRAGRRRDQPRRVGQPLADDVPRRVQRQGVGRPTPGRPRARTRTGWRTTSSPRSASAARRSSRRAARPRRLGRQRGHRPRARLGAAAPPTGDWVSMAVPSDGSYDVPEGIISQLPGHHARAASGRSSRAWSSSDFSRGDDRRDGAGAGRGARRGAGAGAGLRASARRRR